MAEKSDPLLVCGPACAEPASTDAISAQNDEVMAIKVRNIGCAGLEPLS